MMILQRKSCRDKTKLRTARREKHVQSLWDKHEENAEYADSGIVKSVFGREA